MAYDFPSPATLGQIYQGWVYDGEKWVLSGSAVNLLDVAVAFTFGLKPAASAVNNIPMTIAMTVASGLVGSRLYCNVAPTGGPAFTVNKISGGSTSALGTVTTTAGSKTAFTLAGTGGSLAIGDIMQIVAPGTQDGTMADIGITIATKRT